MSGNLRWLLSLALLAAACSRLDPEPGADFGVQVVGGSSITAIGKLSVRVGFTVSGCDAFDPAIRIGASAHAIDASRQGDGTWLADVPVDWLRVEDFDCLHDALRPHASRADLVVTCRDGGRSASAGLDVAYGTATRAFEAEAATPVSEVRYLFASPDPLHPVAMQVSWVEDSVLIQTGAGASFAVGIGAGALVGLEGGGVHVEARPLAETRAVVAEGGTSFVYSMGCPLGSACPDLQIDATTALPSEAVAWMGDESAWWDSRVPRFVLDMSTTDEQSVAVLSQPEPSPWNPTSVLSVVTKAPGYVAPEVKVLGVFPGELVQSRFSRLPDGRLAWLAWIIPDVGPIRSVLRTTDGATVDARSDPTGDEAIGEMWGSSGMQRVYVNVSGRLSPDASRIVLSGGRLIGVDGGSTTLPAANWYAVDGNGSDVAWPTGAVALWKGLDWIFGVGGSGTLEVFDAAPPHARRFAYDVGPLPGGGNAALYGATAVGDRLVLTTASGVRVLGPDGALVGGADPLPCGLATTSRATRVGPTTFAIGAGSRWYVFDLAEP